MSEKALAFDCRGESLFGVVHLPDVPSDVGVVVVVGGPQYRVGSHRQFVRLARALAGAGYAVLRFDVRGMGDGSGAPRRFDELQHDIASAIEALLAQARGVRRVALWGLCDGASAAWLYVQASGDARVCGVCAVNPWVRSAEGLARTQVKHYYTQRVMSLSLWSKLLRGDMGWSALREFGRTVRAALAGGAADRDPTCDFRVRMAEGCARCRRGSVLLVLSGDDYTAKEFIDHVEHSASWQAALRDSGARRCDIAGADHTLSQAAARGEVERATVTWLGALGGSNAGDATDCESAACSERAA